MNTNTKPRFFHIVVAGIIIKDKSVLLLQRHINFLVHLKKPDQKPVISEEHQLAKWFSKKEIESLENISAEVKNILLSILTFSNTVEKSDYFYFKPM